jgi:hypothetical protein
MGLAQGETGMNARIAAILLASVLSAPFVASAQKEREKKDHDELRALLKTFTDAFNTRNLDPLLPYLHKDFTVTMVNQDLVTNPKELKGYLDKQFNAPGSLIKDVRIEPEPDIETVLLDGRIGINRGKSTDTYTLKDGRVFVINTRWTGTAIRENGRWKVLNAHIGLNFLDNPVMDYAEMKQKIYGAAGLVIGILLGVIGALLVRRRRPA